MPDQPEDHLAKTDLTADPDSTSQRPRRTTVLLLIAAVGFIVDLASKILVVETLSGADPIRLLGGAVYLTLARNPGAAFSMGEDMTIVFTFVVMIVIVAIAAIARKVRSGWWATSLGLILGGALGNLVDRLFRHPGPLRGAVVDFISVFDPWGRVFPIFNAADSCIVIGGILAVILAFAGIELDGRRHRAGERKPEPRPDPAE